MAPRPEVTAPPFVARPGGLFAAAPPTEFGSSAERLGVSFLGEPHAEARSYADGCEAPAADRAKVFDRATGWGAADPFTVYGGDVCSPVGSDLTERDRRTIAAVMNGEERAVERVLWTGVTSNGETVEPALATFDDAESVAAAVDLKAALAALEGALAASYGGVGIIHLPADAAAWATYDAGVEVVNGRLQTRLGNRVVAGGGYPGTGPDGAARPAGGSFLYATGAIAIRRGPVDDLADFAGSLDRATNDLVRVGERTYVVAVTGPVLYASATFGE